MGVAERAVQNVDIGGGGGGFRLPRRDCGTSTVYHTTCRLRAEPVLTAKLTDQGEKYGFSPYMGYVVHFNAYPSVVGAEIYRKVAIPYDSNFFPVCEAERSTAFSITGETV